MTSIRYANQNDLEGIMALYKHLVSSDLPRDDIQLETSWKYIMSHPEAHRYIVAEVDDVILSTCNIAIIPNLTRSARPYAVIENVITHPSARRLGLGRKTIEKALSFANENHCYKVMLLSGSHREEAHRFYESLGFNGDKKRGFVKEYL